MRYHCCPRGGSLSHTVSTLMGKNFCTAIRSNMKHAPSMLGRYSPSTTELNVSVIFVLGVAGRISSRVKKTTTTPTHTQKKGGGIVEKTPKSTSFRSYNFANSITESCWMLCSVLDFENSSSYCFTLIINAISGSAFNILLRILLWTFLLKKQVISSH